jgi:hypothetical protein
MGSDRGRPPRNEREARTFTPHPTQSFKDNYQLDQYESVIIGTFYFRASGSVRAGRPRSLLESTHACSWHRNFL